MLAAMDPAALPMPRRRGETLVRVAEELASGRLFLHAGVDRREAETAMARIPGVGPWTTAVVAMRALGDPDVFLPSDLGVLRALGRLGAPAEAREAKRLAEAWAPWRSYAVQHLWASLRVSEDAEGGITG
jgi:AraC family transcriptional regulator of adaptative response / DNA-3-methyladenine glycosylase II